MNGRSLITGLVLVLAVAGLVAVFLGDGGGAADRDTGEPGATVVVADGEPAETGGSGPRAGEGQAEGALPEDGVVVYYFHGHKRCRTCNTIEAEAEQTLRARYADLLGSGTVVFRSRNIETDAHRHFVADYELASKVVVMSVRRGGREVHWRRLDQVWQRVGDQADYRDYIAANLEACLRELDAEAG
jgi:hypothetical protein